MRNQASILVGLLWCVVLLSIVVVSVLHTATMDLKVAKNSGDKIQAHYLALAGIEKARALLHQASRTQGQNAASRNNGLLNAPDKFREVRLGRGQFSIFRRATQDEGGGMVFGVSDEESRLNVNTATAEELVKLDGLTVDTAAALLAWRGQAPDTNAAGANADYYGSLQPPYQPRGGPFQTLRELLMVRGVTPELLFGGDTHQNGFLPAADDGASAGADNLSADDDAGWSSFLTVDSTVANVNAAGIERVNVQTADQSALTGVNGIRPAVAKAIVEYRNQHRYESIADLLDVTPPKNQNGKTPAPDSSDASSSTGSGGVIDEDLLTQIGDDITTGTDQDQPGLINVNTAGLQTLLCLPGMDREHAQAIVSYVRSQGSVPNIAWLLKVPGVDRQLFKQIAPFLCARSETFRILSEGRVKSTGTSQRIQVVVHVSSGKVSIVSYREDNL